MINAKLTEEETRKAIDHFKECLNSEFLWEKVVKPAFEKGNRTLSYWISGMQESEATPFREGRGRDYGYVAWHCPVGGDADNCDRFVKMEINFTLGKCLSQEDMDKILESQ